MTQRTQSVLLSSEVLIQGQGSRLPWSQDHARMDQNQSRTDQGDSGNSDPQEQETVEMSTRDIQSLQKPY